MSRSHLSHSASSMGRRLFRTVLARAFCAAILFGVAVQAGSAERRSAETERLIDLIFDYRAENGLTAIPFSPTLERVARLHANDLERYPPSRGRCGLHSWSADGAWSPCCFDPSRAQCMWDKPREISRGQYTGDGFEIVCWNSQRMTAAGALRCWRGSAPHHDVLLNRGVWRDMHWGAVGIAVTQHYAVVWLGKQPER